MCRKHLAAYSLNHASRHVCVCLTKFVSIFSSCADSAPQHLDVFAAGAAVELVDPVLSPTHGVSHLRLVLHVHAEVDPVHTEYLLRKHTHTHIERLACVNIYRK